MTSRARSFGSSAAKPTPQVEPPGSSDKCKCELVVTTVCPSWELPAMEAMPWMTSGSIAEIVQVSMNCVFIS